MLSQFVLFYFNLFQSSFFLHQFVFSLFIIIQFTRFFSKLLKLEFERSNFIISTRYKKKAVLKKILRLINY